MDLSLNLSLDLLSQKVVQVSFVVNSMICTCVEIGVDISGFFFSDKVQVGAS